MENKKIKQIVATSAFNCIFSCEQTASNIFKYQPIIHAKSEQEAMRKRYAHVMNRILLEEKKHDRRVEDFTFNGRIIYSSLYKAGPTLVDCIRLQLYTRYTTHDNRKTNHLYRCSPRFKRRFITNFGASWTLQYRAIQFFMHFAVLCSLTRSVYVCMCVIV